MSIFSTCSAVFNFPRRVTEDYLVISLIDGVGVSNYKRLLKLRTTKIYVNEEDSNLLNPFDKLLRVMSLKCEVAYNSKK